MDGRSQGRTGIALGGALILAACAGHGARDFGGRWVPLNPWGEEIVAVPLRPAHVFAATPIDGTLRALLQRWAREGGAELDYRHPDDFTLHAAVADIRTATLEDAVARLDALFSPAGAAMRVEEGRVVVEAAGAGRPPGTRVPARGGS